MGEPMPPIAMPPRRPLGMRIFMGLDGRLRAVWRVVIYLAGGTALVILAGAAAEGLTRGPLAGWPERVKDCVGYVFVNSVLLLLAWVMLRFLDRKSFRALGLWFYPSWLRESLAGAGLGMGLLAVVTGVLVATGKVRYLGWAHGWEIAPKMAGLAIFFLLAAAAEEIVFRGYVFQRLVESIGPLGAILVLSALFGYAHSRNPSATALSTANTVLAGAVLSACYLKTKALWLPIAWHWAWNYFLGPIFSLPVSGYDFQPALLRREIGGPTWFGGASYGPEGGVVATVGLAVMLIWLVRTAKIKLSPEMERALE